MKRKIYRNVQFVGECKIGENVKFVGHCQIENCEIGDGVEIRNSVLVESKIGEGCVIGPFTNIRKGTVLGKNVKVGAFVELKNCVVGDGTKIPHLSYVGDATIGRRCNIGCGVIFANYDGKVKSRTTVGDDVFIGCNSNIVAPVNIANKTYICAGTTVTKDTEEGDFVIGRVRQENKKGKINRYV